MRNKIRFSFYSGLIFLAILSSCGKKDDSVKVIPLKSNISGDLSEYIQIPVAEYSLDFRNSNQKPSFKVSLVTLKPIPENLLNKSSIKLKGYFVDNNGQKVDSFLISQDDQVQLFSILKGKTKSDSITFIQETFNAYPYMGMLYKDNRKFKKNLEKTYTQQTKFNVVFIGSMVSNFITTNQISEIVKKNWSSFITQYYKKSRTIEGEVESFGISDNQNDEFIVTFVKDPLYKIEIYFTGFSNQDIEKAKTFKKGQMVGIKGTCDSNGKTISFKDSTIEWYL